MLLVKTLVIRSTAEEAMIARKQHLRSSDKVPTMAAESGMRDYLMVICNSFSVLLSSNTRVASPLLKGVYHK